MRVSFILDTFGGGGKERRCLQIIQGLNNEGVKDVQVIIINDDVAYKELYNTSAKVEIIDRKNKGLSNIQTAKALYGLLKHFHPNVVQAWGIMSAGVVLLVKPFLRFRFIASYVADVIPPEGLNKIINKACNVICERIVSNSKAGLLAYDSPVSKGIVIYNGFNEARFNNIIDKKVKKAELNISTRYVVAMVASFSKTKDWQCYLDAAKFLIKQRQDITFLAVGKGPQWDYFDNQISGKDRLLIKMLGRRDDVDELYQICDLTVLCSHYGEGVSNAILESMAWGKPVIASNCGGTLELIKDKDNGMLINEQKAERVATLISGLIDNPKELARMGQMALKTVQDGFLLKRMTAEYLDLYNSML